MLTTLMSWACDELKAMILCNQLHRFKYLHHRKWGSDIPPYQLFRYDISANSFNCAMLESSQLDLLMMQSMTKLIENMYYDLY